MRKLLGIILIIIGSVIKGLVDVLIRRKKFRKKKKPAEPNISLFKKPKRKVNRVFVHCSAASRTSVTAAEIDNWHKERGWSGIGYHYFIRTDGTLEEGRKLENTPAAQRGHNAYTIAICLNGLKVSDFTEAQFDTLRKLCVEINEAYNGELTFHGHCEVSNKTCPVFDYKQVLNLDRHKKLGVK